MSGNTEFVNCILSDMDPTSIMSGISVKTIQSLLRHMGVECTQGLPNEVYFMTWVETFCAEREWILKIFPKMYLQVLMEIWDSKTVEMDELRWEIVQYLRLFGFLAYKRGRKNLGESSEIYVIEEMKNNFYFYLKGNMSKSLMERYERWDSAFQGLSYYYGMIPVCDMHELFCQALEENITFKEFEQFIYCRAAVWGLGAFLKNGEGIEYFQNNNVEEPEIIYLCIREHSDLNYKKLSYDNLEYIKLGFGVDNRWPGIMELGNYLIDQVGVSYYNASVLLQTVLISVQNGTEFSDLCEKFDLISFKDTVQKEKAIEYLNIIYENVPLYEYKGHSRFELNKIQERKAWKNNLKRFRMILGGKQ